MALCELHRRDRLIGNPNICWHPENVQFVEVTYTGTLSHTINGYDCINWLERNEKTCNKYTCRDNNFCRKFPNIEGHWCYVDKLIISKGWDSCDVPKCINHEIYYNNSSRGTHSNIVESKKELYPEYSVTNNTTNTGTTTKVITRSAPETVNSNESMNASCTNQVILDPSVFGFIYGGVFNQRPNTHMNIAWNRKTRNRRGQTIKLFITKASIKMGKIAIGHRYASYIYINSNFSSGKTLLILLYISDGLLDIIYGMVYVYVTTPPKILNALKISNIGKW